MTFLCELPQLQGITELFFSMEVIAMKRFIKPASIIVALLIVALTFLSVAGLSYYEVDFRRVIVKGFGDIDWGLDVSGGSKVVLTNSTEDEADIKLLKDSAKIIEKRIALLGLKDYELYVSEKDGELVLTVPRSVNSDYSSQEIAALLTSKGELTVRPSAESEQTILDSSSAPMEVYATGDTAKEVLLSAEELKEASWFSYFNEDGTINNYLSLQFNKEGTEKLGAYTNPDTGRFYNQVISVWLDDRMLSSPVLENEITDGNLSVSNYDMTESKVNLYVAILNSGTLPQELIATSLEDVASTVENNPSDIIMFAGIAAFAVIALIMLLRYKLTGVSAILAVLCQFTLVLSVITGFFFTKFSFMMTIPSAAGLMFAVLLTVLSAVIIGERIRKEDKHSDLTESALNDILKKSFKNILDINVIVLIISLMGMFFFGSADLIIAIFRGAAVSGIYGFCYVAFFGAVFNFISGFAVMFLLEKGLMSFIKNKKASLFGGANK